MQPLNEDKNSILNDPAWFFLAEYSLSKLMVDIDARGKLDARLVLQTIRDFGMPSEHADAIEKTLIGFIEDAIEHLNHRGSESPVYIRLFCQKKAVGEMRTENPASQFTTHQTSDPAQILYYSEAKIHGGWGYFLIERSGGFAPNSHVGSYNVVDLYLYREGG